MCGLHDTFQRCTHFPLVRVWFTWYFSKMYSLSTGPASNQSNGSPQTYSKTHADSLDDWHNTEITCNHNTFTQFIEWDPIFALRTKAKVFSTWHIVKWVNFKTVLTTLFICYLFPMTSSSRDIFSDPLRWPHRRRPALRRGQMYHVGMVGWLVGFLTSSSTTRLYRGPAPRQSVWQFYVLPHMMFVCLVS